MDRRLAAQSDGAVVRLPAGTRRPYHDEDVKLQYLGDSKDSFKWDYHDYLVSALGYRWLNVALMLTPDDGGTHGTTEATRFPARPTILDFCRDLRSDRNVERLKTLPKSTGGDYSVQLHQDGGRLTNRQDYFSGFDADLEQVVFLDPDNGFEPEKSYDDKHVRYLDVTRILGQLSDTSVISVFHHFRRVRFHNDFARIKPHLGTNCYATAVYWHSLMFVAVGKSKRSIEAVAAVNQKYATANPVAVIDGQAAGQ